MGKKVTYQEAGVDTRAAAALVNEIKADVSRTQKQEDDPKTASIWLSDDDWRIPIEMRGEMPIGPVRVFLTKHENL